VALRPEDPVGRGPELERLGEVLSDLEAGTTTCVVVEGEPGIGKTWLLSELRRRAEARGHLVLAGSAGDECDLAA
jgi:predicted ATPase